MEGVWVGTSKGGVAGNEGADINPGLVQGIDPGGKGMEQGRVLRTKRSCRLRARLKGKDVLGEMGWWWDLAGDVGRPVRFFGGEAGWRSGRRKDRRIG